MNSGSYQSEYTGSWALIVGIDAYSHLSPLQGAVNDATAVAAVLKDKFEFPEDHIFLLLNEDATQRTIVNHLEILAQRAQPDDRAIFFYAGHGATRKTALGGEVGYISSVESQDGKWNSFIRIDDVTRYSSLIAAKHIFYVFDACFSGLALMREVAIKVRVPDIPRWIADCMTHRARQVLTAGLAEQPVGDLTEESHSIFASYLLRALAGEAMGSEEEITATRVMGFVADKVMKDPRSQQKPAYGDLPGSEPGGDFVFKYPGLKPFRVPANREGGINTGILVKLGQKLSISASGVITYDSGHHFTNADGVMCTYKGLPLAFPPVWKPAVWPHENAYRTNDGQLGLIGSLIGWIGEYSQETAFLIGEKAEISVNGEGYLYLAVNDAKGTYADNEGEYEVTVRVIQ
ncbi:MAG: caspase family protein [Anaerolineae bacterium]